MKGYRNSTGYLPGYSLIESYGKLEYVKNPTHISYTAEEHNDIIEYNRKCKLGESGFEDKESDDSWW